MLNQLLILIFLLINENPKLVRKIVWKKLDFEKMDQIVADQENVMEQENVFDMVSN